MNSIGNILQERLTAYSKSPKEIQKWHKDQGKEYNKRWNNGVQHFQKAINKDRENEGIKPVS